MKDRRRNGIHSLCSTSKGFTLVELIVVLVIIAILAALAIPALLGFIDDAHKKQVISRAQTALASTQASLSDIYTLNDNEFTVEKRDQTRINAGESNDTAFTVWNERPLYDERKGNREATVAVTEELGSYTVAQAIFDAGDSNFAAYDGEKWEVYDSLEAAKAALGIADEDERVIYVWPYDDYSDTARQPEVDPTPDPDDPLPDPPVVLAMKTVTLKKEKKDRAFFANSASSTEIAKSEIQITFTKDDLGNVESDWTWNDGNMSFSYNGENLFLNLVKTYIFRHWTEEATGYICKTKSDIEDYIFDDSREEIDDFTFIAQVIRDPNIKEQAVVSNSGLNKFIGSHNVDNVEMVPQETYDLDTLPASIKKDSNRIDDYSNPGYYIYAWYDGNTLKWWTNALVAFMPKDCNDMLSNRGGLHHFSFQGFDVSKVEKAERLFASSKNLRSVDFGDEFIAPNLTELKGCFSTVEYISGNLDLSGIQELGKGLNLEGCFAHMKRTTSITFGDAFKKAGIRQFRQTFDTCADLQYIDLSGLYMRENGSCYMMFNSCQKLKEVELGGDMDLTGTTSLKRAFSDCKVLERINGRIVTGTALNDMREFFNHAYALVYVDVSGIDPTNVTDFRSAFKDVRKLEELDLSAWNGKPQKVKNLRQTFMGMSVVKELDLSNWNLSDLEVLFSTFNGCSSAQIILNGWNDRNLAPKGNKLYSVGYAFNNCSSLTGTVDLSYWATTGLAGEKADEPDPDNNVSWDPTYDFRSLFNGCSKLECVILREWDLSNVVYYSNVFTGCSGLKTIDFTGMRHIKTDHESDIKAICTPNKNGLTTVILKNAKFDNITTVGSMYSSFTALEYIDLSGFSALRATSAANMFNGCSKLTTIKMQGLDLHSVTDASGMFKNCSSLEEFTESGFNMGSVTNMSSFFEGCTSLKIFNLSGLPVANVTNMNSMFKNCKAFKKLNLSAFPVKSATTMKNMFEGCSSMEELDISEWELLALSDTANISDIFKSCSSLKKLSMKKWRNQLRIFKAFLANNSIYKNLEELDLTDCDLQNREDMSNLFKYCIKLKKLELSGFKTGAVTNMSSMFIDCCSLQTVDISSFDVNNVTTVQNMFKNCFNLESINLGTNGLQFNNIKTMEAMFQDCISLKTADFSKIRTGNQLESTRFMFKGCFRMPKISIEGLDLSNVTIMTGMFSMEEWVTGRSGTTNSGYAYSVTQEQFEQDSALTEIVFGPKCVNHRITKQDNVGSTFKQCIALKTIYAYPGTDFSVGGGKDSTFDGCRAIVGGKGTTYINGKNMYARIDGAGGQEGYFTEITAGH